MNHLKATSSSKGNNIECIYIMTISKQSINLYIVSFWFKLDGVAPLIADPAHANFTTMHSRLVLQDRN